MVKVNALITASDIRAPISSSIGMKFDINSDILNIFNGEMSARVTRDLAKRSFENNQRRSPSKLKENHDLNDYYGTVNSCGEQ